MPFGVGTGDGVYQELCGLCYRVEWWDDVAGTVIPVSSESAVTGRGGDEKSEDRKTGVS